MATPWVLIRFVGMRGAVTRGGRGQPAGRPWRRSWRPGGPRARRETKAVRPAARSREGSPRPAGRWRSGWGSTRRAASAPWPSRSCGSGSSTSRCARPRSRSGRCCLSTCSAAPPAAWPGSGLVARVKRPLWAFLFFQCLLLAWSAGAILLIARLPPDTPVLAYFDEAWRTTGSCGWAGTPTSGGWRPPTWAFPPSSSGCRRC